MKEGRKKTAGDLQHYPINQIVQTWSGMAKEVENIRPVRKKAKTDELPMSVLLLAVACGATMGCAVPVIDSLLIAVAAALIVPLMIWKPFLGLIGLVLLVPFEELTTFGFSFTFVRVVGAATFVCWLLQAILKRQKIKSDLFLWLALLFLAWSSCSLLWTADPDTGIAAVLTIAQLVLLYLMSSSLIDSIQKLRAVMGSYIAGASVAAIMAILRVYEAGFATRASVSILQDPNHFARAISVGLILAAYLACTCRGYQRYLYLTSCFLMVWGVLLSGSRGAWLAVLASIVACGLYTKRKIFKITLITTILIALLFHNVILSAMPPLIADRVVSMDNLAERGSGRLDIWMVGLEMVKENWLAGVGINGFLTSYNDYIFKSADEIRDRGEMRDAHNSFLCLLAELGLLGFLLFSMLWLVSWKSIGGKHNEAEETMGISMLVYLFFAALTGTEHLQKFLWIGFLIVNLLPLPRAKAD